MTVEIFATAGTFTWTAPAWLSSSTVTIECFGSGGDGAAGIGGLGGGGGGGSGGYSSGTLALSGGNTLTLNVDADGNAGQTWASTTGIAPVDTAHGVLAYSGNSGSGGGAGSGGSNAMAIGSVAKVSGAAGGNAGLGAGGGGGGGAGSGTGTNNAGGNGGSGTGGTGGAPTSEGGTGGDGGAAGAGNQGQSPAAGGGGGAEPASAAGGLGSPGMVILTYPDQVLPVFPLIPGVGSGGSRDCQRFGQAVETVLNSLIADNLLWQTAPDVWRIQVVPGILAPYAGSGTPYGWLLCDGSSYPVANYADLFAAIGYTYGGAGANFNVPNLTGHSI